DEVALVEVQGHSPQRGDDHLLHVVVLDQVDDPSRGAHEDASSLLGPWSVVEGLLTLLRTTDHGLRTKRASIGHLQPLPPQHLPGPVAGGGVGDAVEHLAALGGGAAAHLLHERLDLLRARLNAAGAARARARARPGGRAVRPVGALAGAVALLLALLAAFA